MRKAKKQEVLHFINSLHQAHEEIKEAICRKEYVPARNMLGECQEFAVTLGESIERMEGEGHVTVSYVEEYCETLFRIHEEIYNGCTNENKIYKLLRKQLLNVENSVKNDISVKKEVVFFPYKASMWDSLESVYLAAKEDPECDVYCVPIPYYEINPDHSFGKMHYEGDQYPKNIEVTDWQIYSFEERKPDVVYIHNAYDDWNLVTSVHPRFYSANLKKYVEELRYIPYFILKEIDPEDQSSIDRMKHFCFMPGIVYADKVIVQSEKMKQIYVNEYRKAAKAVGLTGEHLDWKRLEQKFYGVGSPKFDKVINTKKEEVEIPKEWLKVIRKSDWSFKKIVFYNTSITSLLAFDEKWLDKIEDVLRMFRENQKSIVLLWRPHPLIENTMRSMRPGILERYLEIKERYIEEGWGIYDDSADLDRAVILSDAYYGDGSSVVQLYQKTGKPVYLQDVALQYNSVQQKMTTVSLYNYIVKNNRFYCKSSYLKGVLTGDEENVSLILKNEDSCYGGIAIAECDNKIYFPPMENGSIEIFDIEKEKVCIAELPKDEHYSISNKFYNSVAYDKKIYMFPGQYPYIVEYNLVNKKITRYEFNKEILESGDNIFSEAIGIVDNMVYLASWKIRGILIVDLDFLPIKYNFCRVSEEEGGYRSICHGDNGIYVADNKGNILFLEAEGDEYKENVIYCDRDAVYRKSIRWHNYIIFFDNNSYHIVTVNEKTKTAEKKVLRDVQGKPGEYGFPQIRNDHLEIFDCGRKQLIWIDQKMRIIKETEISVNEIRIKDRTRQISSGNVLNEYIFFCEFLKNEEVDKAQVGCMSGDKIYRIS